MTTAIQNDPYASRVESVWKIVDRADPTVWGQDSKGPLTSEQISDYESNGFLLLPQLFSEDEVSTLLEHAEELGKNWPDDRQGIILEPDSQTLRSLFRLHQVSSTFQKTFSDPRLLEPVKQLLASDVYIHQSRINYKPALDGKEFFWHSDFETWHVEDGMPRMRAISASIFLTESHEFNGPLMLIPGSHRKYVTCVGKTPEKHYEKSLRKQEYGVPNCEALQQLTHDHPIVAPKGLAGSVILFDCNTMHGSSGNLSTTPRINLFAVFNSVENELQDPFGNQPPRPDYIAERTVIPVETPQ